MLDVVCFCFKHMYIQSWMWYVGCGMFLFQTHVYSELDVVCWMWYVFVSNTCIFRVGCGIVSNSL